MATVYLGSLVDPVGFSRTVAIKRLHPQFARDPEVSALFLDEARLTTRIRHPNVVPTLDVVAAEGEVLLVMEYVEGESLSGLLRLLAASREQTPLPVVSAIVVGVLRGLHAAHEARDEGGHPLHLVHRDVSPQNILVGRDGVARLLDFGIAKALGRSQVTRDGRVKGKLGYMSPEQLLGHALNRRSDLFAAGIVLWELLAQTRLFTGDTPEAVARKVLDEGPPSLGKWRPSVPARVEALVERALAQAQDQRFATASEMADELEACVPPATQAETSRWVEAVARITLDERADRVAGIEARRSGLLDASQAERTAEAWPGDGDTSRGSVEGGARPRELPSPPPKARPPRRSLGILVLGAVVLGAVLAISGRSSRSSALSTRAVPAPAEAAPSTAPAAPLPPEAPPSALPPVDGLPPPAAALPRRPPASSSSGSQKVRRPPDVLEDR